MPKHKRRRWYIVYRDRMQQGFEVCRNCESAPATTFDHLTPIADGGKWEAANMVLLCSSCNHGKAHSRAYHWLKPIAEEPDFEEIVFGGTSCFIRGITPPRALTASGR